jgi:hypothetical protein
LGDAKRLDDCDERERFDEDDILDADERDDLFLVEVELECRKAERAEGCCEM